MFRLYPRLPKECSSTFISRYRADLRGYLRSYSCCISYYNKDNQLYEHCASRTKGEAGEILQHSGFAVLHLNFFKFKKKINCLM